MKVVVPIGFEPILSEPKSDVLTVTQWDNCYNLTKDYSNVRLLYMYFNVTLVSFISLFTPVPNENLRNVYTLIIIS